MVRGEVEVGWVRVVRAEVEVGLVATGASSVYAASTDVRGKARRFRNEPYLPRGTKGSELGGGQATGEATGEATGGGHGETQAKGGG